jgi:hypothetical protein
MAPAATAKFQDNPPRGHLGHRPGESREQLRTVATLVLVPVEFASDGPIFAVLDGIDEFEDPGIPGRRGGADQTRGT